MTVNYTTLLGFALPVTGTESGTWGTVVNDSVTQLVEDSVAGTATQSVAGGDWTLTTTGSGAANQARCAIIRPTGTPGVSRNVIAPGQSKAYIVDNQSNAAVVFKASATTGVTVAAGKQALVAWNGSDFVQVGASAGGSNNQVQYNSGGSLAGSANLTFDGTTLTATGNAIVSDNSSNAALRITQTGAGNALVVEDSANPDSTPFVVDKDGNVIQGSTSFALGGAVAPWFAIVGSNSFGPQFLLENKVADASGAYSVLRKGRNGTIVNSDDTLGTVTYQGFDGASPINAAQIFAQVDGTPGTNDMPGRLVFSTTADGASSPTERFRITSAGAWGLSGANYGTSGQVLTSNGTSSAPTWQTPSSGVSKGQSIAFAMIFGL